MSEEEKKAIWYCSEILSVNENDIENWKIVENLIDRLQKDNKKLNLENQALYESINCNDDNMLARRYEKLQKELEQEKIENREIRRKYANFKFYIREYIEKKDKKVDYTLVDCIKDIEKLMKIY